MAKKSVEIIKPPMEILYKEELEMTELKEKIRENLKTVIDPELNINVVDLGLIYEIDVPEPRTARKSPSQIVNSLSLPRKSPVSQIGPTTS